MVVQYLWHLLGTINIEKSLTMLGQSLQYFCLELGNELLNRKVIDIYGCHSSQECLKCGYTLLFGIIKKKQRYDTIIFEPLCSR
jgi:hypothetical protein